MIKVFDDFKRLYLTKRRLIGVFIVAVLIASPVYGLTAIALVYFLERIVSKKYYDKTVIAVALVIITPLVSYIMYCYMGFIIPNPSGIKSIEDAVKLLLIDMFPLRVVAIGVSTLIYMFGLKLMSSTMADIQLDFAKKARKALLKEGHFNYQYNGQMLGVGTTGSGKTVFAKRICKNGFEMGYFMCILSAKLARSDNGRSLLEYVAKMAKVYNRKLYVVTMDPHLLKKLKEWNSDITCTYSYNPLKHCEWDEIDNLFENLIDFSEPYYRDAFIMWICDIYDVIKASDGIRKLTFNDILELYMFPDYLIFVNSLYEKGIISKEQREKFTSKHIQVHAEIARNSFAKLQRVFRNRGKLFNSKNRITITQARKENAIIYFDMKGASAKTTTKALGAMACAELCHLISTEPERTQDVRKYLIMDECSYYVNQMTLPIFNLSRSVGMQAFLLSQSLADLEAPWLDDNFLDQLIENANIIGIMRQNNDKTSERAAKLADTADVIELTKKVNGIDYDSAGSQKSVEQFIARPTLIRNLKAGEMVLISKEDREGNVYHEAGTCLVHWSYKDVENPY